MSTFKDFINLLDRDKEREGFQLRKSNQMLSPVPQSELPIPRQQTLGQRISSNFNPNTYSPGFTNRVKQGFNAGVQRVKSAPRGTYNVLSPLNLRQGASIATNFANRIDPNANKNLSMGIPLLNAGAWKTGLHGVSGLMNQYAGGFEGIDTGIKNKDLKKVAVNTWQLTKTPLALAGGAVPMIVAGSVGGGLKVGWNKLTGEGGDPYKQLGEGFLEGANTRAVTRFTDPKIEKILGRIPDVGFWKRQAIMRLIAGTANIVEDKIIDALDGVPRDDMDDLFSFIMGGATSGNIEFIKGVGDLVNNKRINASPEVKVKVRTWVRDEIGQFAEKAKGFVGDNLEENLRRTYGNATKFLKPPKGSNSQKGAIDLSIFSKQEPETKVKIKSEPEAETDAKVKIKSEPLPWETGEKVKVSPENEALIGYRDKPKTNIPSYTKEDIDTALTKAVLEEDDKTNYNKAFAKFIGENEVAKTTTYEKASPFTNIKNTDFEEVISGLDEGIKPKSKTAQKAVEQMRTAYDEAFDEAKKFGMDIGKRENYLTHIWETPTPEQSAKFMQAQQKFPYAQRRSIPTYREGIELGWKPKYNNPARIYAEYINRLERTKAAINFINQGKKDGFVVDAVVGRRAPGFEPITAQGFPKSSSRAGVDNVLIDNYYAPSSIAREINRVFSAEDVGKLGKTFDITGRISSLIQNFGLAGGAPATSMNAYTAGQVQKELLSGNVGVLKALALSNIPGADKKFFANPKYNKALKEMQLNNTPISTRFSLDEIDNMIGDKNLGSWVKTSWNKYMEEPTFKKFMPINQTLIYTKIRDGLVKKGKGYDEAVKIANEAVRNWQGTKPTNVSIKESKLGRDIARTFTFAPTHRANMVSFWWNNAKALGNPFSTKNARNIRFLIGATITYLAMDKANQYFNDGRKMSENPGRRQDQLMIPLKDKRGTVVTFPFLTSIGTVPRAVARELSMAVKGDYKGAVKDALHTYPSMVFQPLIDIGTNQDYFGNPVVDESLPVAEKQKETAKYLASHTLTHPYLKELTDPRYKNDPTYQKIIRASEMPVRFTTEKKVQGQFYYDIKDKVTKNLTKKQKEMYDNLPKTDIKKEQDPNERILKYQTYLTDPKIWEAKKEAELRMSTVTGKDVDPLYIINYDLAKKYMRYETLPEGSEERKKLTENDPQLKEFFKMRSDYFEKNPMEGATKSLRPQPSDYVQAQMDAKNWKDPEVRAYLDAYRIWTNDQREKLGLGPLEPYSWNDYGSYQKKVSLRKVTPKKVKITPLSSGGISGSKITIKNRLKKLRLEQPKKKKYNLKVS